MSQSNRSLNASCCNSISKDNAVFWCVSFGVVGLLTFFSNLATVVTFAMNKNLGRHGVYCLVNLAVADMMLGAITIPYYTNDIIGLSVHRSLLPAQIYIIIRGFYITVVFASLFGLVTVSLNRVSATCCPFKYRSAKATTHCLAFMITWLLATAASLVFFLMKQLQEQLVLFFQGLFVLAILIIIISYVIILIKIKGKNITQNQRPTTLTQTRERELATTVFLVTVVSMITWMPSIVFHAIYRTQTSGFNLNLQLAIYLIHSCNSLINPIIYAFRMKDFRTAMFKLLMCWLAEKSSGRPRSLNRESYANNESGQENKAMTIFNEDVLDTKL